MTSWDIDPAGVGRVLKQTQSVAQGFQTHVTAMGSAMETAAPNTSSQLVASALGGFAEKVTPQIESVINLTGSAMTGCSQAVKAYADGDMEMAERAQANAASVSTPASMPGGGGGGGPSAR
jgi:hypothetical protein